MSEPAVSNNLKTLQSTRINGIPTLPFPSPLSLMLSEFSLLLLPENSNWILKEWKRKEFKWCTVSYVTFKKSFLRFIRPSENRSVIKLITILRLNLSHLREHKSRHNFQDTLNPICSCGKNIETTTQYLLHCSNYLNEIVTLMANLQSIY